MSAKWKEDSEGEKKCQGCGKGEGESKMVRCKGCESVWYCGKVCVISSGNIEERMRADRNVGMSGGRVE